MGVWQSRVVVGHFADHCVLWGTSAQPGCTGPLEGRMELFLSRPQYSSSHGALMCFWGRGWEQNGCM